MKSDLLKIKKEKIRKTIDDNFSERFISLDPKGYFIIRLNHKEDELIVEFFTNDIDENGMATDPETGEVLQCSSNSKRSPAMIFRGKTAKAVGIQLTEGKGPHPISKLDHALYIGRELQKAEYCLMNGTEYIQD